MAYWIIALVLLLLLGIIISNLMALKSLDRYKPPKRDADNKTSGVDHPYHRWDDEDD